MWPWRPGRRLGSRPAEGGRDEDEDEDEDASTFRIHVALR